MGIIPLFDWGEANALFFMEKFTLINKARSRIKVFEPFEDSSKNSRMINAILISYGYVFKRSSICLIHDPPFKKKRRVFFNRKHLKKNWEKTNN